MAEVFDELTFNVGTVGVGGAATWTYWSGSTWSSLSVTDGTNNFLDSGTDTVTFTIPSDWAEKEIDASACTGSRYYVRLTTGTSYTILPLITQMSAQTFNLKVQVQNELGTALTGLSSSAFAASDGTTTTVFALREIGSGAYELALDTAGGDVNFNLKAAKDGYATSSALATGSLTSALTDKTGTPLSLNYAYKVTSVADELSTALTSVTMTAGNSYGTSCTESGGAWYCPVPLADTELAIKVAKDGYVTNTASSFGSDRTAATDSQVSATVTTVRYAFKVSSAADELSNALSSATVTTGDSYGTTCTESGSAWYCAVPLANTGLTIKLAKDGYVTNTGNAFASDRTAATDAQVTGTVTTVRYAFKVSSAADELSNALSSGTVTTGDSYGTTCTESGSAWYCAVPLANTGLTIKFAKDGYVTNTATSFGSDRTAATDSQVTAALSTVRYAFKVSSAANELSSALSSATVTTGDSYGTTCTESASAWYCAVPLANTGLTIKLAKDGYVTNTGNAFASDRTAATDSQVTGTVTSVQYAFKVTSVANELSTALTSVTVATGNSYGTSCTESSGAWYCPVPLADTGVAIQAAKDGYVTNTATSFGSDRTSATDAQVTAAVTSLAYAFKVSSIATEASQAITGGTVTTGDSYGTTCAESSGAYYCPVPLADTGVVIKLVKDGYVTNTGTSFSADRTTATAAQVTASVTSVLYALKLDLETEDTLSGITIQKQTSGGAFSTATPDASSGGTAYFAQSASQVDLVYRATRSSITDDTGTAFSVSSAAQTVKTLDLESTLSSLSTSATSLVAGATSTYTFTFTNDHTWPVDGKTDITFPSGFTIGSPTATLSGATGTASTAVSGQVVTVTRNSNGVATPIGTAISISLAGIENPGVSGSSGSFSITLKKTSTISLDSGTSPSLSIASGDLQGATVSASSLGAGVSTTYTFAFQPANAWGAQAKLVVTLPSGYSVSSPAATLSGADGSASASIAGQVLTLTRSGGTQVSKNTPVTATVTGVTNPSTLGSTGTFGLSLKTNQGIETDSGSAAALTIVAGPLASITLTPGSASIGVGAGQSFSAAGVDAFGNTASFTTTWSADCGSVSSSGTFTAPATAGTCTLTALSGSVSRTATITVAAGTLSSVTAVPVSLSSSTSTTYAFTFTLANAWPANGKLAITFPSGYTLGTPTASLSGATGTASVSVSSLTATLTRANDGAQTAASSVVTVALAGITNPSSDGSPGSFALSVQDSSGGVINSGTASSVSILSSALSVRNLVSSSNPASVWKTGSSFSVSWTSPTDTTVSGYSWRMDADPDDTVDGTSTSTAIGSVGDGVHSFKIKAKNLAGTWGPVATLANLFIDSTAPATPTISSSTHPLNSCSATSQPAFTWISSDATSGLAASQPYGYQVDGGSLTRTGSTTVNVGALADGAHSLTVVAYDAAGNSASSVYKFTIDRAAPSVSIVAPAVTRDTAFRVDWSTVDTCGTASALFLENRVDGGEWGAVQASGISGSVTFPAKREGKYEFRGRAVDGAGNGGSFPATAQSVTLVDRTAPASPKATAQQVQWAAAVKIAWNAATDAVSGVNAYNVYSVDSDAKAQLLTPQPVKERELFVQLKEGSYALIAVTAIDLAGNEGPIGAPDQLLVLDLRDRLPAPGGLTVQGMGAGYLGLQQVLLVWQPVLGAGDYAIYASATDAFDPATTALIGTTTATAAEVADPIDGKQHYLVAARNPSLVEGHPARLSFIRDTLPPESSLSVPAESGPAIIVSWSARDSGLGVARVDLYVVRPGESPRQFHSSEKAWGNATYWGVQGKEYAFFSVATDKRDLVEARAIETSSAGLPVRVLSKAIRATESVVNQLQKRLSGDATLAEAPVISDENEDGLPDTFEDPNGRLSSLRTISLGAARPAFVLAERMPTGAFRPTALWDPASDEVLPLVTAVPVKTPEVLAESSGKVVSKVTVDKGGWIFVPVPDPDPSRGLLEVRRGDGTPIPEGYYWRMAGQIVFVDDPSTEYSVVLSSKGVAAGAGIAWWSWTLMLFGAMLGGGVAWLEIPSAAGLERRAARGRGIAWGLRHCRRCKHALDRTERILRPLHDCRSRQGRHRASAKAHHWWQASGLVTRLQGTRTSLAHRLHWRRRGGQETPQPILFNPLSLEAKKAHARARKGRKGPQWVELPLINPLSRETRQTLETARAKSRARSDQWVELPLVNPLSRAPKAHMTRRSARVVHAVLKIPHDRKAHKGEKILFNPLSNAPKPPVRRHAHESTFKLPPPVMDRPPERRPRRPPPE